MATIKIIDVISQAETIIQDKTNTRWPKDEWLNWFNGAVLAVVGLRPDANISNTSFPLVAGKSLQVLPADGLKLINVLNNEATGKQIRRIDKRMLDDQVDNWYKTVANEVDHFVYDDRDPKHFWVYPHTSNPVNVRIVYSKAPSSITIANFLTDVQVLPIDDSYMNPLLDFMMYRAYSKDADYAENAQRAQGHLQTFQLALGAKTQGDNGISASNSRITANG